MAAPLLDAKLGSLSTSVVTATTTLTTTAAAAANTKIIASIQWFDAAVTLNSVSGGGLTWRITKQGVNGSVRYAIVEADAPSGAASGLAILFTFSAGPLAGYTAAAESWLNLKTGAASSSSSATGTGTAWATGSTTPGTADALVIGGATDDDGSTESSTPTSPATEEYDIGNGPITMGFTLIRRIVSALGSYPLAGTWASGGTNIGVAASFDTASADGVPASDISAGSWTRQDGVGTSLFSTLDDPVADDTDFIESRDSPASADIVEVKLTTIVP